MHIKPGALMIEKAATPQPKPKTNGFRALMSDDGGQKSMADLEMQAVDAPRDTDQPEAPSELDQADEADQEQAANAETQGETDAEPNEEADLDVAVEADPEWVEQFDQALVVAVAQEGKTLSAAGPAQDAVLGASGQMSALDTPLVSDWAQAFAVKDIAAQTLTESDLVPQEFRIDSTGLPVADQAVEISQLGEGAIKLKQGFVPVAIDAQIPLDLAQPKALEQLNDLVALQIRASKSPEGAKRLTLLLSPAGLGRMQIMAQSDQGRMLVQLKVEQGDAARMLEQILPQLEAQIVASTAMPVEFELVQEDSLGTDSEAANSAFEDGVEDQEAGTKESEGDLVEEWNQALEDPVLERGQTLHVVA